jgi:hypothetical protein
MTIRGLRNEFRAIIWDLDTIPVEILLVIVLGTRSVLSLQGAWMTAPAYADGWLLWGYLVMGIVHLGAIVNHWRVGRSWCCIGQTGAWAWISVSPWLTDAPLSYSPPPLLLAAFWTLVRNGRQHRG